VNARKANNTIDKVRQLQRKLYLTAKGNSKRKFHALYDKVYRKDILMEAWKRVRANKGTGGIDQISIEDVEKHGVEKFLEETEQMLRDGRYHPLPVRRVYIDKGAGKKRPLGIPTVNTNYTEAQLPFGKYNNYSPIPPFMRAKLCNPQSEGGERNAQIFATDGYRSCLRSGILDRPASTREYSSRSTSASF